ncbi:MAG: hypothetical protein WED00_00685 [Aquisalimonadaceae bacterium]
MEPSDITLIVASAATALGTLALAIITGIYVHLTRRLVQMQSDPCIVVFTRHDLAQPSSILVVIKNIGHSLARDITFDLDERIPEFVAGVTEKDAKYTGKVLSDGPLITGIPALAPGEERAFMWGQWGGLSHWLERKAVGVTCHFKRGDKLLPPTRCVLEVKSFENTIAVDTDGARKTAKVLEKIEKRLSMLARGHGRLRVLAEHPRVSPTKPWKRRGK